MAEVQGRKRSLRGLVTFPVNEAVWLSKRVFDQVFGFSVRLREGAVGEHDGTGRITNHAGWHTTSDSVRVVAQKVAARSHTHIVVPVTAARSLEGIGRLIAAVAPEARTGLQASITTEIGCQGAAREIEGLGCRITCPVPAVEVGEENVWCSGHIAAVVSGIQNIGHVELAEVGGALRCLTRSAGPADSRGQQAQQYSDQSDHQQQLHEGEAV